MGGTAVISSAEFTLGRNSPTRLLARNKCRHLAYACVAVAPYPVDPSPKSRVIHTASTGRTLGATVYPAPAGWAADAAETGRVEVIVSVLRVITAH